ncbi:hypothetical protein KR044_006933 [Drosophila immigrans]|nr:hypothetical protein KR044_006933 [Drosophila immigrans]
MDILDAVAPLLRVSQLCNLWQWRLDPAARLLHRSRWLESYSLVILCVSAGYLLYGLFDESRSSSSSSSSEVDGGNATSNIGHTVDYIQLMGIRVAHITSLLEALWQRQTQQRFFAQLREIDRDFASMLHIDVDNAKLRQQMTRRGLWMLAGYSISQGFIIVTKMFSPDHQFPIYWICYLLPLLVLLYQRLWLLVGLLNRCYGLSMLVNLGNDFLAITSNCYWIFLNFRQFAASPYDFLQILGSTLWTTPHLGNVLALALLCERAAYFVSSNRSCPLAFTCNLPLGTCFLQTTRLALSLHHIRIDLQNDSHNALITQFSLQLLHQRLCFSAAGFFSVDCTLLYTIVGATTTYLIILIQFHMSEISFSLASAGA